MGPHLPGALLPDTGECNASDVREVDSFANDYRRHSRRYTPRVSDDPPGLDPSRQIVVAHDLRNMLAVVRGYSGLLLSRLGAGAEGRSELEEIDRAAARAAVLASELAEELDAGSPQSPPGARYSAGLILAVRAVSSREPGPGL